MKNLFKILTFLIVASVTSLLFGSSIIGSVLGLAFVAVVTPETNLGFVNMAIPLQDARNLFTKMTIAIYRENIPVPGFFRSFFPTDETRSKEISIEVQRGTEKVAVDVERGTNGNRNKMTKSTQKIFVPPFYWEYLTANEHALYDVAIGMQSPEAFAQLSRETADEMIKLRDKIERAYELQCAQVLETGVVELAMAVNIDFKRKSGSLVDLTGSPWTVGTNSPYDDLNDAALFIRQKGKTVSTIYNVIMGSEVHEAFMNNDIVKERADIRNFSLDMIREPQRNSTGGTLHGEVSAGSFKFRLWTYPEFYDNASGVSTPYMNPKKFIVLPEAPKFKLVFGAVPQLIGSSNTSGNGQSGAYMIQNFIDERATTDEQHIKSAGVAVPIAVDQMYTGQPVG